MQKRSRRKLIDVHYHSYPEPTCFGDTFFRPGSEAASDSESDLSFKWTPGFEVREVAQPVATCQIMEASIFFCFFDAS